MTEREFTQNAIGSMPSDEVSQRAATLNGELLLRGRSRARDLVKPPRKSDLRPPAPPGEQKSAPAAPVLEGNGMREVGLMMIWVSVFLATFLIGLSLVR